MGKYSFRDIVIDSRTGLNPRKNFKLGNGNNYYITIKDIHNGRIEITDKTDRIDDEAVEKIKKRSRIKNGDILFTSIGRIGETAIVHDKNDTWEVNESIFIFTINSEIIDAEYFCILLQSSELQERLAKDSSGSTFKSIKMNQLEKLSFDLPTIAEQRKISININKVSNLINLCNTILEKLDLLVKSRFIELFGDPETNPKGWNRQRLDHICENLDSLRVPITSTDRKAGIYPYYGASGIVDYVEDYIFDEDILLISEDGANLVMRSTPIAFSVSGKVWVNNHAHVVRFESKATQKYIEVCFALTDISGSITGTAQPKLNQAKLNAMLFCIPPLELQEQFAAFVEQTDKSKLAVQQGLQELEILKKSLMQQYFG